MPELATERAHNVPPNLGELLENTLHHAKSLLQAELSLARRELSGELSAAYGSLGLLVIAGMFLQAALSTLAVVLVLAFGVGVAAIGLIVLLAAVGVVLTVVALRALERRKLPRTTARLAMDAQQVMETVK
ncbi:MAG TPA: phage holin family protein [Polyangiaceae bacterium]|nr:phage holin family protein [Polyangiaceae bacterium]